MILDVGCHTRPRGDVNVDVVRFPGSNFVLASACHLPFRDNVFDKVICRHVLEHLADPGKAVSELRRVAWRFEVAVPVGVKDRLERWLTIRIFPQLFRADHLHFFSYATLYQLLAASGATFRIRFSWKTFASRPFIQPEKKNVWYGVLEWLLFMPSELVAGGC